MNPGKPKKVPSFSVSIRKINYLQHCFAYYSANRQPNKTHSAIHSGSALCKPRSFQKAHRLPPGATYGVLGSLARSLTRSLIHLGTELSRAVPHSTTVWVAEAKWRCLCFHSFTPRTEEEANQRYLWGQKKKKEQLKVGAAWRLKANFCFVARHTWSVLLDKNDIILTEECRSILWFHATHLESWGFITTSFY